MDGPLFELAQTVGVPTAMLLLMWWSLATGRLVTRREHDALVRNELFWRQMALRSLEVAEDVLTDIEEEPDG
jgi:hypothetical protein